MEAVTDFIFLCSKITADGDGSHEIKGHLAPWRKSYDKPRQHIKKQRRYSATKICIVKAMVFPVVMYGCESWPPRSDAFELSVGEDSCESLGLQGDQTSQS